MPLRHRSVELSLRQEKIKLEKTTLESQEDPQSNPKMESFPGVFERSKKKDAEIMGEMAVFWCLSSFFGCIYHVYYILLYRVSLPRC